MSQGVLVLNFTYEALNVATLERAVRLVFTGKAEVLVDRGTISSVSYEMPMPSIIRMLYFIKRGRKKVELTKKNVLLRDDYVCGYCGAKGTDSTMTVDHIKPKSHGGKSSWENLTAACAPCNGRKSNRTPEQAGMPLRRRTPHEPASIPFFVVKRHTAREEWWKYLGLYSVSIDEKIR